MSSENKPGGSRRHGHDVRQLVTISAGFARTTRTAQGRPARLQLWRRRRACPACNAAGEGEVPRACRKAFGWRSTRTAGDTEASCDSSERGPA